MWECEDLSICNVRFISAMTVIQSVGVSMQISLVEGQSLHQSAFKLSN